MIESGTAMTGASSRKNLAGRPSRPAAESFRVDKAAYTVPLE